MSAFTILGSPMVDKKMVQDLAALCRIQCDDEEQEAILKDFNKILDYMKQLKEVDTEDVAPCDHVIEGMVNVTREDKAGTPMPRRTFLDLAPEEIGGMVRVPPVIKENG